MRTVDPQETLDVHCGNGFDEYRGLAAMSILHAETLRIWTGDTRDTRPGSDMRRQWQAWAPDDLPTHSRKRGGQRGVQPARDTYDGGILPPPSVPRSGP